MQAPRVFVIDNYDSFTYNLTHYLEPFCSEVVVKKNDQLEIQDIENFDKILISPGPGLPKDAGKTLKVIKHYHQKKSILGICLGMQAIGTFFNAELENLKKVMHGKSSIVHKTLVNESLFSEIEQTFQIGRYHSWVVSKKNFPHKTLSITCETEDQKIMGIKHNFFDVKGVQFHPESVMTEMGRKMIKNWANASFF